MNSIVDANEPANTVAPTTRRILRWEGDGEYGPRGSRLLTSATAKSRRARRDMEALPLEPFWLCQWRDVVFLHLEADPELLQRVTPFELDLFEGRAFVSLVAFTLSDMRPRIGGGFTRWLFRPFGTHRFLNVRAYVKHGQERGIHFLAEYLDAPRLNHLAGPLLYGLPFHPGQLHYQHAIENDCIWGTVTTGNGRLAYEGRSTSEFAARSPNLKLAVFLLERYRAYTDRNGRRGWFPVWHESWNYQAIDAELVENSLLRQTGDWAQTATLIGAHRSAGLGEVWMGLRQRLRD